VHLSPNGSPSHSAAPPAAAAASAGPALEVPHTAAVAAAPHTYHRQTLEEQQERHTHHHTPQHPAAVGPHAARAYPAQEGALQQHHTALKGPQEAH
jgi:hypothetical protein